MKAGIIISIKYMLRSISVNKMVMKVPVILYLINNINLTRYKTSYKHCKEVHYSYNFCFVYRNIVLMLL